MNGQTMTALQHQEATCKAAAWSIAAELKHHVAQGCTPVSSGHKSVFHDLVRRKQQEHVVTSDGCASRGPSNIRKGANQCSYAITPDPDIIAKWYLVGQCYCWAQANWDHLPVQAPSNISQHERKEEQRDSQGEQHIKPTSPAYLKQHTASLPQHRLTGPCLSDPVGVNVGQYVGVDYSSALLPSQVGSDLGGRAAKERPLLRHLSEPQRMSCSRQSDAGAAVNDQCRCSNSQLGVSGNPVAESTLSSPIPLPGIASTPSSTVAPHQEQQLDTQHVPPAPPAAGDQHEAVRFATAAVPSCATGISSDGVAKPNVVGTDPHTASTRAACCSQKEKPQLPSFMSRYKQGEKNSECSQARTATTQGVPQWRTCSSTPGSSSNSSSKCTLHQQDCYASGPPSRGPVESRCQTEAQATQGNGGLPAVGSRRGCQLPHCALQDPGNAAQQQRRSLTGESFQRTPPRQPGRLSLQLPRVGPHGKHRPSSSNVPYVAQLGFDEEIDSSWNAKPCTVQ